MFSTPLDGALVIEAEQLVEDLLKQNRHTSSKSRDGASVSTDEIQVL